jgi:serine/threonine-protein kinase
LVSAPALTCPEFPFAGALLCSKYRLVRELGSGGMGTVWLARNEVIGKDVAVKLLRSDVTTADAVERFVREARAAACVDHSAIVRVYDYGHTDEGQPFIVMERLSGESLSDMLERRHSLPALEAVRVLLPVLEGLAAAHEQGIVHRDLKPENVFLAREGSHIQPKVLDFGVAKWEEKEADLHLTRQGVVVGSPFYMAPEQARGLTDVDRRCDVWAACIVLYEAVAGSNPFAGDNYNAVLTAILEQQIPPLVEVPGEEGLWDVLALGLERNREHRLQSMHALGEALALYLARHDVHDDVRGVPLSKSWPGLGMTPAPSSSVRPYTASARSLTPVEVRESAPTVQAATVRRPLTWAAVAALAVAVSAAGYGTSVGASGATANAAIAGGEPSRTSRVVENPKPRLDAATNAKPHVTQAPRVAAQDAAASRGSIAQPEKKPQKKRRAGLPLDGIEAPRVGSPGYLDLKDPY